MNKTVVEQVLEDQSLYPLLQQMKEAKETTWINPGLQNVDDACEMLRQHQLSAEDIADAAERLERFAPLIAQLFPETEELQGRIESPLCEIEHMHQQILRKICRKHEDVESNATTAAGTGKLLLKKDSHLAIAGSVKARGGIYEVLKHAETLALAAGIITSEDNYVKLARPEVKDFFHQHKIQVGSTGNLGLSIGIMSAVLGFQVIVHMSADAKQWKKDLLRSFGAQVAEYASDYSEAVKCGRKASDADPMSYFVDDENSKDLFLGYAVAAKRLAAQLDEKQIPVDADHPLFVFLPCGVGGAPGGITYGLKMEFGDYVHCFFAEPVQAPCMMLGMATGLHHQICVQEIGLTGQTAADGLAVGRPSGFVGKVMVPLLSGASTVDDERLPGYLRNLYDTEGIFIEPSACAGFDGYRMLLTDEKMRTYLKQHGLEQKMQASCSIIWATGGSLVPEWQREQYLIENT